MYDCVIFDIDGTMTDSESAVRLSLAQLMEEEFGSEVEPDEIEFTFGVPGVDSLRNLGFCQPEAADERWGKLMLEHFDTVSLFPGIEELLRLLKNKGIKLGIVTSKKQEEYEAEFLLPYAEVAALFDTYVCADDTERRKPFPDPMNECLKRLDVAPHNVIYIGDTLFDYFCARDAGVDFALALWGARTREGIEAKYNLVVPSDLAAILEFTD